MHTALPRTRKSPIQQGYASPSSVRRLSNPVILSEPRAIAARPTQLLAGLTEDERKHVLAHGERRVLSKGQKLFQQGILNDGIYIIERGRIRVFYVAPSGREITRAYWSAGEFVGGPDVFGRAPHAWSGIATNDCIVFHVAAKRMLRLVSEVPSFAIGMIDGLAFKGRCSAALAQMLGTRAVNERLAHLLLHLADVYGRAEGSGTVIDAGFTHADLAHLVGATRQWITETLKRLQEKDVLELRKGGMILYRFDVLTVDEGA